MGQTQASCCGSKCGQPTIVSIGDEVCPPRHAGPEGDPGLGASDALPEWLSDLAPSLIGEEAERAADAWVRCGEELRRRTRQFVRRATCGVPCWYLDQRGGRTVPASYILDESFESFLVETAGPCETPRNPTQKQTTSRDSSARHVARECKIAEIGNIWICADSELARRIHGTLRHGCDADLSCVMLIDAPSGPIALVEKSSEAREEFLDCMAVLISAQRLRNEPEVACCRRAQGPPPPEARLRPFGKSLQSMHISGPICVWLAQAAEDLLPATHRPEANHAAREVAPTSAALVTAQEVMPSFPGTEMCPPKAVAAQKARPTTSGSSPAERVEVVLVDIDAPSTEGLRGPVPLMTPKRPGTSSTATANIDRLRPMNSDAPGTSSSGVVSAPEGAIPVRRGSSAPPDCSPELGAAATGRYSEPAALKLEKATLANGQLGEALGSGARAQDAVLHTAITGAANRDAHVPTPGPWQPAASSRPLPVKGPPASFDGMPMMMGGWVAEQPQTFDPTILSKSASNHFVLPPGPQMEYPCNL